MLLNNHHTDGIYTWTLCLHSITAGEWASCVSSAETRQSQQVFDVLRVFVLLRKFDAVLNMICGRCAHGEIDCAVC